MLPCASVLTYLIYILPPFILGLVAQNMVKNRFAKNSKVAVASGLSGGDVARRILDANGLHDVEIHQVAGGLTDHYDPRSRSMHLQAAALTYVAGALASLAVLLYYLHLFSNR
jgi:Zn-dependent membrane protease YugP